VRHYPGFRSIDGRHPLREAAPGSYVDYPARRRHDAEVLYFDFGLAREMGLLPARHPDLLTAGLRRALLDAFALVIVNEHDQAQDLVVPEPDRLPHPYMATRYLQLQHPGRQGRSSGDGRSVWNGCFRHRGDTWDLSSCGTGVTRLCPATAIEGRYFQTGNAESDYACGTAALAEGLGSAVMSRVFHRNGIETERVLCVLETPRSQAIVVRASRCLLRPSHFFAPLHQNDLPRLRGLIDHWIERRVANGDWPPLRGDARYRHMVEATARTFARTAATFESEYIFCWLDWDGDNILADGGIIDYGSVRQFGLYHREYRFADSDRLSTTIPEQRRKARDIVRKFCQIREALIHDRRPPLSSLDDDPALALFDGEFAQQMQRQLLRRVGFDPEQQRLLERDEPRTIERFARCVRYFERARARAGPVAVPDGLSWNAIFCVRDVLRELPGRLADSGEPLSPRAFVDLAASSYASRRDRRLFPHRCRMARDLQRHYLALVRAVSRHDGVDEAALLQELAARTAILDPPARMTGDGIDHASALLQRHRRRLSPEQLYRVVERFASEHHLEPDTDERPPPLRGAEPRRLLERMLDIVEEYRESL